ncbi:MAG: Repeat domain in Vibrio, Colwellia, Bradyrhizobium and Shewanella [Deltaproteobacteria bacterium]|nr:Repeat domain in Vibrio, Colwellia, Bradyrhizobium and Shewanella [Deltaproteobacteria bacterium]
MSATVRVLILSLASVSVAFAGGCAKLLGISDPIAGDGGKVDGDGNLLHDAADPDAMIDSSIDAPPPCTTSNAFGTELSFDVGAVATGFAVGKLDALATLDVAIAVGTQVVILHGDGAGNFGTPTIIDTAATGVVIGDFDPTDGRKDLVLWSGDQVVARRQTPSPGAAGTFLAAQPLSGPFTNVTNVLVEQFSGPSAVDLLIQDDVDRRVYTQLNTAGTFSRENLTIGAVGDDLLLVQQINNALDADVALVDQAGNVKLSLNTSGGLQPVTTIATGATGHAAAFGKFDGDALLDLVIATSAGGVVFAQNPGAPGTFTQVPGTIPGIIGNTLFVSDINQDGTDDVVVPGSVVLQCPGTPGVFSQVESVNATAPVLLVDLDGNGKPDLLRLEGTALKVRMQ